MMDLDLKISSNIVNLRTNQALKLVLFDNPDYCLINPLDYVT